MKDRTNPIKKHVDKATSPVSTSQPGQGVLIVPPMLSPEEWEKQAIPAQQKLIEEVRK